MVCRLHFWYNFSLLFFSIPSYEWIITQIPNYILKILLLICSISAELVTKQALFPGESEIQQLLHIFRFLHEIESCSLFSLRFFPVFVLNAFCVIWGRLLGTPNEEIWPGASKLPNWHVYPQWKPKPLSSAVPNLDKQGLNLLAVSTNAYFHTI